MEDSRKGKRSRKKGLPPPDPHVEGGNGKKAIVYNTKKRKKEEGTRKETKRERTGRKKKRNTTAKRKNLVLSILVLGHVRRYFLYMYA